jgi:hypothetical protein
MLRVHWGKRVAVAVVVLMKSNLVLAETVLDTFEDLGGWSATATDGVQVEIGRDAGPTGMALRIDFNFATAGGHLLVRKNFPALANLPANYAFRYFLRGTAPPIDFEFKLVDKSQKNVWWYKQRDYLLPAEWREVRIKKPRLDFAWGPLSGGPPQNIGSIELAISGSEGDKGSVWIDYLVLEERKPAVRSQAPPKVTASTSAASEEPRFVLDEDPYTRWRSGSLSPDQWLLLDFGQAREYGGLVIDWDPDDYAVAYEVQVSDDGETWHSAYRSTRGNGGRDYIYLPDGESRLIRLDLQDSSRRQGYAIRTLVVKPLELAASPNAFFESIAREAPAGSYPKYYSGRQTYWTVVGVPGDDKEALINEEGMIEVERGAFSIEPFLFVDGRLVTWNDVQTSQELTEGYLPIPIVTWFAGELTLTVTAVAVGEPKESALLVRYRVDNLGGALQEVTLYLAVRPFQVLPPWQSLNMVGGVTPIQELVFDARTLWVNRHTAVVSLTPPSGVGATTFDEGQVTEALLDGTLPQRSQVSDPVGYASAAMGYALRLGPQEHREVYIAVPFHDRDKALERLSPEGPEAQFENALARVVQEWKTRLGCVDFTVPPAADQLVRTLKSTLAYILINRDEFAIQPGSRTYARSWIRDGAMTSAALLEMGFTEEVRDFIRWYQRFQYEDGKIPCCIDRRGPDPLPEHDSNGEYIYAIAEYYRYTRDIGFVHEMWPSVVRAVDYLEGLRAQRTTDEYKQPDKQKFYGLLPESISHEGYASHPVHSYWDDYFAVRGLKDAVLLAVAVDDAAQATRMARLRDGLQTDLQASVERVIAERKLDVIPASADLGDFDPSSTAIALDPAGERARLPAEPLRQTFLRYYDELMKRQNDQIAWEAYAPYELRNVGALVRLGDRRRAHEVLDALLGGQRPAAWNHWAEIVWKDPTLPKFIGDMPHTWIGSGFIEAVRSLFAYEREEDSALVIAAGIPFDWVNGNEGVGVKRMPTHWGVLSYSVRAEGPASLRMQISGDFDVPAGGIVVQPPLPAPLRTATANGQPATLIGTDQVVLNEVPADVLLEYEAPAHADALDAGPTPTVGEEP